MDSGILKKAGEIYSRQYPKNIRLDNIFQKPVFLLLQKKLSNSKFKLRFHPYKHKYFTAKSKDMHAFINGRYFKSLIEKILKLKNYKIRYEIRKFEHGDYTLLHDADDKREGVDFIIDFSKPMKNFGGNTVYLSRKEELLILNPSPNTLSFVDRRKGMMSYTKYIQHRQKYPILQAAGTILK
jgi:hypothetical protein